GDLLPLLRRLPLLPGRWAPLRVRWRTQSRHRSWARTVCRVVVGPWGLVGRGIPVLARGRIRRCDRDGVAVLAPAGAATVAVHDGVDPGRGVRTVPLRRGRVGGVDPGGHDAGHHGDGGSGGAAARRRWRLRGGGGPQRLGLTV